MTPDLPPTPPHQLDLVVRADGLRFTHAALQVIHVHPDGRIEHPNRSADEITYLPASFQVQSNVRQLSVDLDVLHQRLGPQVGHLYAVTIHSQPQLVSFQDLVLEVASPGQARRRTPLRLLDHVAMLGVWWQDRAGVWRFEESGEVLGLTQTAERALLLTGRYVERLSGR